MSVDEEYLSTWFVHNYIGQCAQLCSEDITRLFTDVSNVKLQKAISEIVCWRLNTSVDDLWNAVQCAEFKIPATVSVQSLTVRSCVCWINELAKIDKRFSVYFSAVALLHVACKISRNGCNDELMNILSTMLDPDSNQCCSILSQSKIELNTSELLEFLQKSAVEHLTTYRQLQALDFGSVVTIVTTDFEALYAYKRGDYQRCLQLSTQNANALRYADSMSSMLTFAEFIQLMDDDIVSLTALTLIVNPKLRNYSNLFSISQLTLSLYLMIQCQLKLHHSVMSLTQTLLYVKVAQKKHPPHRPLDHLTLKLVERKTTRLLPFSLECRVIFTDVGDHVMPEFSVI